MKTQLIEFKNQNATTLRGILTQKERVDKLVFMIGGFERTTTTEKKFKSLSDKLAENNIASFRFDFEGVGLSDGDFGKITVSKMCDEFKNAQKAIKQITDDVPISIVAHSLSGCVVSQLIDDGEKFEKIVFIAPALNQRDLLRYFFASSLQKKNPKLNIAWENFNEFVDENEFEKDCRRTDKMTKTNYINPDYFLEVKDKNYEELLNPEVISKTLLIYGDQDTKAPMKNLTVNFENKIIVQGGDHDLERPDMLEQWLDQTINFLK